MNYTNFIIKIIAKPTQSFFDNEISVTELIGKFYQYRNNKYTICKVSIWGPLSHDINQYYQINDYVFVEGYISIRESIFEDLNIKTVIEISAFKAYPFVLNPIQIKK
jgi:hypothetical protein